MHTTQIIVPASRFGGASQSHAARVKIIILIANIVFYIYDRVSRQREYAFRRCANIIIYNYTHKGMQFILCNCENPKRAVKKKKSISIVNRNHLIVRINIHYKIKSTECCVAEVIPVIL